MPSDARPNLKTGCVWDQAPQESHPHSRLFPQMLCFVTQKPKSSTNHDLRTHKHFVFITLLFLSQQEECIRCSYCIKVKGALDHFIFSHVRSSLRSQKGQIYFGTLSGNSVDSVSQWWCRVWKHETNQGFLLHAGSFLWKSKHLHLKHAHYKYMIKHVRETCLIFTTRWLKRWMLYW